MPKLIAASTGVELGATLVEWWSVESTDWDQLVEQAPKNNPEIDTDLWDDLPTVDSKAIARSSPIFERFLGIPLDVRLIRLGGYKTIQDAVQDLVPKMVKLAETES